MWSPSWQRFGRNPPPLTAKERSALTMLTVALILYYPLSGLIVIGGYASLIARPLGVILAILSFRALCLAASEHVEP